MPTIAATSWPNRRPRRLLAASGVVAALVLAGCGAGSGSDGAEEGGAKATTTTAAKDGSTTTTAPDDEAPDAEGLPTEEADAPSGDWISVRFNVAVEPEPDDFNQGSAEARLYAIEPDCSGSGPCALTFSGGGEGGNFGMPGTPDLGGEPVTLEPDGDAWTDEYDYPEAIGCTAELDGPYLDTHEERSLEPVYGDDGEIDGLVGTILYTDTLTAEGKAAGCPNEDAVTYAYAVVVAPNDGIRDVREYEVDGTFRQTLEVTDAEGQVNPLYQDEGISTTLPDHDIDLAGSCTDGECSVELTQVNGDDQTRTVDLTSADGRGLSGTYEEQSGCSDDETGETVFDSGAYDATGGWEDLTPIWIEDGQVKALVGRYSHVSTPTDLGKTDPSCSTEQSLEGWVYLIDTGALP